MRLLLTLILIPTLGFCQIMIGPLTEGEYYNKVVYEGIYNSPGHCTWADGTDFMFDFSGLTNIDGMQYFLVVDEPDPAGTGLLNGWSQVNVGDSIVFGPGTVGMGISAASGPTNIHFHLRLIGTPTTAGQNHPCWIDEGVTEAVCDNIYALFTGESPVPCAVQSATTIEELKESVSITAENGGIIVKTTVSGFIKVLTLDGRLITEFAIHTGTTSKKINHSNGLLMIMMESGQGVFSKKILLQK